LVLVVALLAAEENREWVYQNGVQALARLRVQWLALPPKYHSSVLNLPRAANARVPW
jgi:hypothetical protein